jgi:hypothetical protein
MKFETRSLNRPSSRSLACTYTRSTAIQAQGIRNKSTPHTVSQFGRSEMQKLTEMIYKIHYYRINRRLDDKIPRALFSLPGEPRIILRMETGKTPSRIFSFLHLPLYNIDTSCLRTKGNDLGTWETSGIPQTVCKYKHQVCI